MEVTYANTVYAGRGATNSCEGCCFNDMKGNCIVPRESKLLNACSGIIWIKKEPETASLETIVLATNKQEGGLHYQKSKIQPIEYIHANGLSFFEGNVVKYVTRHKNKNGAEDIRKAIHYLEMILQFEYNNKQT